MTITLIILLTICTTLNITSIIIGLTSIKDISDMSKRVDDICHRNSCFQI